MYTFPAPIRLFPKKLLSLLNNKYGSLLTKSHIPTQVSHVNYNAITNPSPEKRAEFIEWLTQATLTHLKQAAGDSDKLRTAVQEYLNTANAAGFDEEEIENILGVNEPSIMDLAELSEEDEEIVINAFEDLINT